MQEADNRRRVLEVCPVESDDPLDLVWHALPVLIPRILRVTRDEDNTQEGILRLAARIQGKKTPSAKLKNSPQNYCFRAVVTNTSQAWRDDKKHYQGRMYPSETWQWDLLPGIEHVPSPARVLEENQLLDKLEEALNDLSPLAWEVLRLKVLEDWTFGQIAASVGMPLSTVRRIYIRTREDIRSSLKRHGLLS